MGWGFRKGINLGGGFRLNLGKKGAGISAGIKGFRVSLGSTGPRARVTIPGTGIYYETRLFGSKTKKPAKEELFESGETQINKYLNDGHQEGTRPNNDYNYYDKTNDTLAYLQEGLRLILDNNIDEARILVRRSRNVKKNSDNIFLLALITDDINERYECACYIEKNLNEYKENNILSGLIMDLRITDQIVIKIMRDLSGAILLCAEIYQDRGQFDRAIDIIKNSLDINPKLFGISLMEIYLKTGRFEEALRLVSYLNPGYNDIYDIITNVYNALILKALEQREKAEEIIRLVLSYNGLPITLKKLTKKEFPNVLI